ncbi:MAG: 2OG-Fe(II) oxygenase [Cyclobacteriaceae bacterium]
MDAQLTSQLNLLADGLAEEGYAIIDDFLSAEEVESILQLEGFKNGLNQFKKAGIGKSPEKQINESIRGDYIQWIDYNLAKAPLQGYIEKLRELISFVNQSLFLSLKDCEVHQTIYPIGSFYKRHLDQFKKDDHRKLSVISYLNKAWSEDDGGQLRLYLKEESKDVFPLAGRLVCFRSDLLEHEVLPATRARLSLTGWLIDK